MQVIVEEINQVMRKVSIEIPADRVDAEIEKVYSGLRKKAKIEGFRTGKAPIGLIKSAYGDTVREEVKRYFCEEILFQALDDHKISLVSTPAIECDILEQGTPFKYSAVFEAIPEIHIKDYTGLRVTKEKYLPNPDVIDEEIRRLQESMAQLVPVEGDAAAENGHTIFFDFFFSVAGHPDMDISAEGAMLELGAGTNLMMPGFEEQLIGLKCGRRQVIRVALPEAPEGTEGVYQVTLNEIKRKELPALDDEFARTCGCETMEALRAKITAYFRKQENDRIEYDLRDRLIKALIEKNPLEVPRSMVNNLLDHMLENFKKRRQGQPANAETAEFDDDSLRWRFSDSAEQKVKGDLLLMALVEEEKIVVTDEDLAQRYELMAKGKSGMLEQIREYYASNKEGMDSLCADIEEEKATRFLRDHAVITEVESAVRNAA